jgi:hypothetical protein
LRLQNRSASPELFLRRKSQTHAKIIAMCRWRNDRAGVYGAIVAFTIVEHGVGFVAALLQERG